MFHPLASVVEIAVLIGFRGLWPRKAKAWGQSACPTPPRIRRILGGVGHAGRIMGCQIVSNLSMPNAPGNPEDSRGCEACCTAPRQQAMFFLEVWRIGCAWHVIGCPEVCIARQQARASPCRAGSCLCFCCPCCPNLVENVCLNQESLEF